MILDDLDEAGYNTYYKILNAKDYGIPQNRERVFIISIRKDIDNGKFKFPDPKPLKIRLKDLLDDEDILFAQHDFISFRTGCEYYGLGEKPFVRMAREAGSVYKIGKMVRVNRIIFEEYLRNQRKVKRVD